MRLPVGQVISAGSPSMGDFTLNLSLLAVGLIALGPLFGYLWMKASSVPKKFEGLPETRGRHSLPAFAVAAKAMHDALSPLCP